jgi:hypothetical protein
VAIAYPHLPYSVRLWISGDEPAGSLKGLPDEDQRLTRNLALAVGQQYVQPWSFDYSGIGLLALPDENERWQNPNQPLVWSLAWPQPWTFDVQEPAGKLYGIPDENELRPLTYFLTQWIQRYPQPWMDVGPVGLLGIPDDNEQWQNPNLPLGWPFLWSQQWPFDVQEPAGSLYGVPDDDQMRPLVLRLAALIQQWMQPWADAGALDLLAPSIVDADEARQSWLALAGLIQQYVQPWGFDAAGVNFFNPLPVEDEFWQNWSTHLPFALQPVQQWPFETQEFVTPGLRRKLLLALTVAAPRFRYVLVPDIKNFGDVRRFLQRLEDEVARAVNAFGRTVQTIQQSGGGTFTPDLSQGQVVEISVNDATPFTINDPLNVDPTYDIVFTIFNNTAGAIGAITFSSTYHLAGAFTTPGAGKRRTITFYANTKAGQLYEKNRSAQDI